MAGAAIAKIGKAWRQNDGMYGFVHGVPLSRLAGGES
ncbi:MAG: hypothetical protein JWM33_1959 [Caulobacteraceae bacterium]|nr:hypothetical protein [Caulobacteraceae bacterium]